MTEQPGPLKCCSKCRVMKPLDAFGADNRSRSPLRLRYSCKDCDHTRHGTYRRVNSEERNRKKREHRLANPEVGGKYQRVYREKHPTRSMIGHARKRAAQKGVPFDLDQHEAQLDERLSAGVCEMTGIPFRFGTPRSWDTPSIDRIEPAKGYVYGNVRLVLSAMNMAMGNWGEEPLRLIMTVWLARTEAKGVT